MLGIVLKAGFELIAEHEKADYLVVNTCGFLESARQEAVDILTELFDEKRKSAKVIVTGCMIQNHRQLLESQFPKIHAMLSAGSVEKILEAINGEEIDEEAQSYIQMGEVPRFQTTPNHYAYLKIAEGCRKRCSFCIIPKIKGPLQSKSNAQVLREFKALLSSGVKEVILIAQDLGDYGKDRKERQGLEALLKELLKVEGDYWLRLLYLYPDEITDELIAVIKSDSRLVPYLDMPIQHINNTVLKKMHRKTNRQHIISTITKLREEIPDIVIRTSLMVGFPGETEEQFEELVEFVNEYRLDNVGIFSYSREKESYSNQIDGHLSNEVKQARFKRLSEAQARVAAEKSNKLIGKKLEVVIEGYHPESNHLMIGRYYGQCPDVDGSVIINDCTKVHAFGERYLVEITDAIGYDLIGGVRESSSNVLKII
ncbi:MAG: 30S ribosomal protein S12 methylthiotransferase RimO [Simkaniaceae bacterium]|nr:30S ribosomal protein S12 methylthiotransferase RimO [Simkaniaceae bacterium]